MSNMTIQVEFLAATDVETAIQEAKEFARVWKVAYVKFNFNGIKFSVSERANVSALGDEYRSFVTQDCKAKFIVG